MTYRDDHDAALARADALEKELADARAEHQRDEQKIAALEAELRAKPRPAKLAVPPAAPDEPPAARPWWVYAVLGAIVVAIGLGGAMFLARRPGSPPSGARPVDGGWDVQQYLGDAIADAKRQWSDVELMKITADYVDSSGRAHLAIGSATLSYWFRSPSRSAPPPAPARIGMPAVPRSTPCQLRERIRRQDASLSSDTQTDGSATCGASLAEPLHCTIREIWQRAIGKGAPASALASIRLRTEGDPAKRTWRFEIDDATGKQSFRASFDDDCR